MDVEAWMEAEVTLPLGMIYIKFARIGSLLSEVIPPKVGGMARIFPYSQV